MAKLILSQLKKCPKRFSRLFEEINYADPHYWESRYDNELMKFEWYANYRDLKRFFTTHIPKSSNILNVGNGTSSYFIEYNRITYSHA